MIRFIPELIITSGREVIVQYASAGEEACCVHLLFPHLSQVHVQAIEHDQGGVLITARVRADQASCHRCAISAVRRHSHYRRRLHDLSMAGQSIPIDLEVRRFFCDNASCDVHTFVEQVPTLTQRHARRTPLLRSGLEAIALALAGRAGARPASMLGLATSRSTLKGGVAYWLPYGISFCMVDRRYGTGPARCTVSRSASARTGLVLVDSSLPEGPGRTPRPPAAPPPVRSSRYSDRRQPRSIPDRSSRCGRSFRHRRTAGRTARTCHR
ncbi:hypothetical protein DKM19_15290 [Streptosporangium sp. 'caverna']|nr:hypothetical protein DKM19_15290 [Streptosporangium sp. 'caverna']